jgi:hypothetical protein
MHGAGLSSLLRACLGVQAEWTAASPGGGFGLSGCPWAFRLLVNPYICMLHSSEQVLVVETRLAVYTRMWKYLD